MLFCFCLKEWLRKEQKAANGVKSEGNLIYDEMKFFLRRKTVIHDRYKATTSFPIEKFKILLDDWLKQANSTCFKLVILYTLYFPLFMLSYATDAEVKKIFNGMNNCFFTVFV